MPGLQALKESLRHLLRPPMSQQHPPAGPPGPRGTSRGKCIYSSFLGGSPHKMWDYLTVTPQDAGLGDQRG